MKTETSPYTHFLPLKDQILFFVHPLGGYQFSNYFGAGHCLIFNRKKQTVTARGKLQLPEDAFLFILDHRLMMVTFDEEDGMNISQIQLDWI